MLVDSDSSILFKNVQKRSKTLDFLLDTCILFWAKVLPQHESTVWLLMSYFACGSMSQLLSESKCYFGKRGINFAKSPSTFACFATQWRRWSIPSVQFCLRSNDWFTTRHFWKTRYSWQISFQRRWEVTKLRLCNWTKHDKNTNYIFQEWSPPILQDDTVAFKASHPMWWVICIRV